MTCRLCELDYTPLYRDGRLPAMITLTYPGDWLTVVPTGQVLKRHMKALRKRYLRAWGEDWTCVWKLEFQRRGEPHVHLLCTPPHALSRTTGERFAVWLSAAWAGVVNHPDPEQHRRHQLAGTALDYAEGLRATDPRRVAAYFTKHGLMAAKEYQHEVPAAWREPGHGPGAAGSRSTTGPRSPPLCRATSKDGTMAPRKPGPGSRAVIRPAAQCGSWRDGSPWGSRHRPRPRRALTSSTARASRARSPLAERRVTAASRTRSRLGAVLPCVRSPIGRQSAHGGAGFSWLNSGEAS